MNSTLDTIKCPKCGESIPVSEALTHQIEERAREEFRAELTEQKKHIAAKEKELIERAASIDKQVAEQVSAKQVILKAESDKRAKEAVAVEIASLLEQAKEKDELLAKSQAAELELRKKTRDLEEREKALALETQRTIDAERQKIEQQTEKRVQEQYHLKDAEKDKKLRDALIANEELRRKLEQGSQQTQGEVLELHLESEIQRAFPLDTVEPIAKGVAGADILQKVINRNGSNCGSIIWELKRTKTWSDGWIAKLKEDQQKVKADIAILVSEALPRDCINFMQINGVWVTSPECALALASALRASLVELYSTKLSSVGKNEKMELLYQYLSGPEFRQRMEAILGSFVEMQKDLNQEKRAAEKVFSKREKQLQKVISNTSGLHGDLQGLIGAALKDIPALEAPIEDEDLEEENE